MLFPALEFQCGVMDITMFQGMFDFMLQTLHVIQIINNDMSCQGIFCGTDSPNMHVMYVFYSRYLGDKFFYFFTVYADGHTV